MASTRRLLHTSAGKYPSPPLPKQHLKIEVLRRRSSALAVLGPLLAIVKRNRYCKEGNYCTWCLLSSLKEIMMAPSRNRSAASALFNDVKAMGSALLDSRKMAGAEKLAGFAEAAQTLSESLKDTPLLQDYAEKAAESLGSLARYIERRDMDEILEDAIEMAKKQPVLTLTLTIVGGIALTQMLRNWRFEGSSARRPVKAVKRQGKIAAKRRKK